MTLARRWAASATSILRQHFCLLGAVLIAALSITTPPAFADVAASSSRADRNEAMRAIPWRQIAPQYRRVAQNVVGDASIYRRLPTRVIDCDPEIFTFLLQHPEVVIDVWRVMGISQVGLEKLPNGAYCGTDGAGTAGTVRFLHANWKKNAQNTAVIFAEGTYDGKPFVKQLKVQSVILLRSGAVQEANGRHYITVRIDTFLKIEQMGIELVAKSVQPWISKTADRNFIETLTFVSNFSRTAEKNPQGMKRLATRLGDVDQPTRDELVALCFRTAERYAQRDDAKRTSADIIAHRADPLLADAEWIKPIAPSATPR
ncbi:MAG: hypothetical protein L0228_16525 [Planctomycetes bacterium]|nr:hypothetical protein [Planctomycetota bacterium]